LGVSVQALEECPVKRRVSASYARGLDEILARGRFDIVHAHMYASAAAAAVVAGRHGVPLVITEHSDAIWRNDRARRTSRDVYRRAAQIIAVSGTIARRLCDEDGVAADRVRVIRNALPPIADLRESRLDEVAFSGDPVIGMVARLVPEKGVATFLGAASLVLGRHPNATFVIVGNGPLRDELSRFADVLGIAPHVRFLGARLDGPRLVAGFDVLAVPSLNEGTPLVTLEALSAGVAIVASAVGGIPEQVAGFERVALVPPGDTDALARALTHMARLVGAAPRSKLSSRAIALLPGHEAMVRETEAVYAQARGQGWRIASRTMSAIRGQWLAH
jgi:glycosyltransferase involved in cell wall biosynthesis